jgi:hypothetical protein
MFIKQMTVQASDGRDVVITRTDYGCEVHHGEQRIACIERDDSNAEQFEHARVVTGAIYGWVPRRGAIDGSVVPNASNAMLRDVLHELHRVAGM